MGSGRGARGTTLSAQPPPRPGMLLPGPPDIERVRLMQRKGKQDEGLVAPSVGATSSHLRPPEALALVEGSHLGRFRLSFISWQKVAWSLT